MSKILPTIGPVSEKHSDIKKILQFSKLVRLNGSHNTLEWHKNISNYIKYLNSKNKILLDMPGIKPRTCNTKNIRIKKNEKIIFYFKEKPNKDFQSIKLSNPLPKIDKKCKFFSISDGQYFFRLLFYNKHYIIGKSENEFILESMKGLNIPYSEYNNQLQEKVYKKFLKKYKSIKFDAIGLSFIQDEKILISIKKVYPDIVLVAKIENYKGLVNIKNICNHCDAIMIDRGDLSAEIGENNLFSAVMDISKITKSYGKPLIMATENIDSMITRSSPTKSEIVSLGLSLMLKADRIMLSEETATAKNWYKILKWLNDFIKINEDNIQRKKINAKKNTDIIWNIVSQVSNLPIIIFTRKGFAVEKILSLNEENQLIVFTDNIKTYTICEFRSNIKTYLINKFDSSKKNIHIYNNIKKNKKEIFQNSEEAVLIYISYPRKNSRANSLTLISKYDFK